MSTVGLVIAVTLGVAVVATFVPAVRAARTSTVLALADSARPPRRTSWLIAISARLPVPLLLGLRIASRRPRRTLLGALSIAITVSGIVAVLAAYAHFYTEKAPGADPRAEIGEMLQLVTIMLVAQAAVNAICITWATALDTRHSSALARALGATPDQVSAGLAMSQLLPALAGAVLGLPGGIALAEALDDDPVTIPPLWQLLGVVSGTVIAIAVLTAIPPASTPAAPSPKSSKPSMHDHDRKKLGPAVPAKQARAAHGNTPSFARSPALVRPASMGTGEATASHAPRSLSSQTRAPDPLIRRAPAADELGASATRARGLSLRPGDAEAGQRAGRGVRWSSIASVSGVAVAALALRSKRY